MSFALSPLAILLGLGAVAGALYLLQRLRVRHREVPVVTTLFWKQAVEETRARVFVRRFRHWPAYVLFCAIGALLWLGFAQPRAGAGGEGRTVVLLDASAGMAREDRFATARQELLDDIGAFDPDRTQILLCGGEVRTLLAPGENPLLLAKRLEGLAPDAAPSSLRRALALAQRTSERPRVDPGTARFDLHAYGDFAPERLRANRAVAALGIAEAASGRWDAVDVYVEVRGGAGPRPRVTLDGVALPAPAERDGSRMLWRDVEARGGRLEARLPADALALDDHAAVRLPDRTPIRVQVSEHLPAILRSLVEQDAGMLRVEAEPDVEITTFHGIPPPGHHPVLSFGLVLAKPPTGHAIQVYEPTADPARTLRHLQHVLALAEIDGAALADALGRPVSVGVEDSASRVIAVAGELLEPEAGFVSSRAFPLFLAGALRHLAGRGALQRYAAVGEPLPGRIALHTRAGHRYDPMGTPFVPPVAGDYASGEALTASLLPADPTAASDLDGAPGGSTGGLDVALLVVLLAFALLLVEWTLFRRGRVP